MAACALLAAAGGCRDPEPLRIGVVLPLTGPAAAAGRAVEEGIEIARLELEAEGGPPVILVHYDSGSDPATAARRLGDLAAAGVPLVVGGITSAEAAAMVVSLGEESPLLISPTATSARLSGASPDFFRLAPSDAVASTQLALFARHDLGLRRVALLGTGDPDSADAERSFQEEFQRLGGRIEPRMDWGSAEDARHLALARLTSEHPDGIFLTVPAGELAQVVDGLRRWGYRGELLTTAAFASLAALEGVGTAADGLFLTQTRSPEALDEATPFVLAWRSRHPDTPPSVRAAYGYDALRIAAAALMWAGADRSGLRTALRDPRGHRGASGTIRFDEGGDAVVSPRIFVVEDGRFVDYAAHAAERRRELLRRLDALREGAEPAPGTDGDGAD